MRIYDVTERRRRRLGLVVVLLATLLLAAVVAAASFDWFAASAARTFGVLTAAMGLFGGYLLWPRNWLELDLATRTARFHRRGTDEPPRSLESLGAIEAVQDSTMMQLGDRRGRLVITYIVRFGQEPEFALYETKKEERTRGVLERLARDLRLPSVTLQGEERDPATLDTPLHRRFSGHPDATRPATLTPADPLRIEPSDDGYVVVSTYRDTAQRNRSILYLALPLGMIALFQGGVRSFLEDDGYGLASLAVAGVIGAFVLWMLVKAIRGIVLARFPGEIRITPSGVRYGWRKIRLSEIETVKDAVDIEFVGDRKRLLVPGSFCPQTSRDVLMHELRRLIILTGTRSKPQAG